ncbi:hypothetical protein Peur_034554 [Populus x canadensis]
MNLGQYHHKLKGADFPLWKAICKVWPPLNQSHFSMNPNTMTFFIHQNLVVEPTLGNLSSRVMTREGFSLV